MSARQLLGEEDPASEHPSIHSSICLQARDANVKSQGVEDSSLSVCPLFTPGVFRQEFFALFLCQKTAVTHVCISLNGRSMLSSFLRHSPHSVLLLCLVDNLR